MSHNPESMRETFHSDLQATCAEYLRVFPNEAERLDALMANLADPRLDLRHRDTIPEGHMCASGILVDEDVTHVLMQGHKSLGIMVVPGGHYDDTDLVLSATALREVAEETGVGGLSLHPWHVAHNGIPLDIDTHPIPENAKKAEDAHRHFDFRYLVVAEEGYQAAYARAKKNFDPNEVTDVYSIPISEVPSNLSISPALAKLALGRVIGL